MEPSGRACCGWITETGTARVALADVSVLETRDGKLFKLPKDVFDKATKIILAKLNGPNCPFEILERPAANR